MVTVKGFFMFDKKIFSERLKQLRLQQNLTLETLGNEFQVTKQTTSRWETGDRVPSIDIVYSLANYFNVSSDYLIGLTDNPEINK